MSAGSDPVAADWLQPPEEQEGLTRFVQILRERIWLVLAIVALTTGISVLYVVTAQKVYDAEADLLISPVTATGADTTAYVIAGLPQESSDPTRDVETAARLVTTLDVAARVQKDLGTAQSPRSLLDNVIAEPVAQSDIIAVTASATTPDEAQALANSFAKQAVAERTARMRKQIDERLPALQASLQSGNAPSTLADQITQLEILREGSDPTIEVETLADTPTAPVSPRPMLSIAGGLLAGLILGVAVAFASRVLDPRLRREEQLRRLYRLPILARIPMETSKKDDRPLGPNALSPSSLEAYRTLRATLAATRRGGGSNVILITGPAPSEGKTTTAINLSTSLLAAGNRVILIEGDLRRPAIGRALGAAPKRGVVSVLLESVDLRDALVTDSAYGENLGLLLADYEGGWVTELFALGAAERLIEEARQLADYVIIDSPPLTEVVDALPLARLADDVLIVTRLGNSRLSSIHRLGELLAENGIKPVGFAVVGVPRPSKSGYYYAERSPLFADPPVDDAAAAAS
jgi:capsular exopolysaccharide synthesis family protein